MRVEESVVSGALYSGVTLVTDSVEADRCGIVCLLMKSGLLNSGCQVRAWQQPASTCVQRNQGRPNHCSLRAGHAAVFRLTSISLQGYSEEAGALYENCSHGSTH